MNKYLLLLHANAFKDERLVKILNEKYCDMLMSQLVAYEYNEDIIYTKYYSDFISDVEDNEIINLQGDILDFVTLEEVKLETKKIIENNLYKVIKKYFPLIIAENNNKENLTFFLERISYAKTGKMLEFLKENF